MLLHQIIKKHPLFIAKIVVLYNYQSLHPILNGSFAILLCSIMCVLFQNLRFKISNFPYYPYLEIYILLENFKALKMHGQIWRKKKKKLTVSREFWEHHWLLLKMHVLFSFWFHLAISRNFLINHANFAHVKVPFWPWHGVPFSNEGWNPWCIIVTGIVF